MGNIARKNHFLFAGTVFASSEPHAVTTILGSCVTVCLWDYVLRIGGVNHYQLPFWNGDGLPSPKFGNIAIPKLVEKMLLLGSARKNLRAKVTGGSSRFVSPIEVARTNVMIAERILDQEHIPIIGMDVGGASSRKIIFETDTGSLFIKKTDPGLVIPVRSSTIQSGAAEVSEEG